MWGIYWKKKKNFTHFYLGSLVFNFIFYGFHDQVLLEQAGTKAWHMQTTQADTTNHVPDQQNQTGTWLSPLCHLNLAETNMNRKLHHWPANTIQQEPIQ